MAGKRQHYLPRLLQGGFASRREGKKVWLWLYRSQNPAIEVSTRDVGLESNFYVGADGATDVDEAITELEGPMATLVADLRQATGVVSEGRRIGSLIAHLEMRNRHLRFGFEHLLRRFQSRLLEVSTNPSLILEIFFKGRDIREIGARALEGNKGVSIKTARKLMRSMPKSRVRELEENMYAEARELLSITGTLDASQLVKNAHISLLRRDVNLVERSAGYSSLTFEVVESSGDSLILGDSAVVFKLADGRYVPVLGDIKELMFLALPLCPGKLLVGYTSPVKVDTDELKNAIAACSTQFFVSSRDCQSTLQLTSMLGESSNLLMEQEVDALIEEVFMEIKAKKGLASSA